MSAERPIVSCIIPVRNASETLDRTLRSLQAQTLRSWEAICIDDHSSDASCEMLKAWAARDERIRPIFAPAPGTCRGVAATRNLGLPRASGEFVHFLDSDDTVEPCAFEVLTSACRNSGLNGAAGSYSVAGVDGSSLMITEIGQQAVGVDDLIERVYLWTAQHLVRRESLRGLAFCETLNTYEDLDLWLRLAERGVRWKVEKVVVASYFARPGSLSRRALSMLDDAQRVWDGAFERSRRGNSAVRLNDESEARWERAMLTAAVSYASRAAVCFGDEGPSIAEQKFSDAKGPKTICPELLGKMAYYQVLLGLGIRPGLSPHERQPWRARIAEWWGRCIERGWLSDAGRHEAAEVLDMLILGHEAIAEALVRMAESRGVKGIEIIGYGRNGRLLARRAREAGIAVRARDDRAITGDEGGVEVAKPDAPLSSGWLAVISPLADEALAMRYPGAIRWRQVPSTVVRHHDEPKNAPERPQLAHALGDR